MTTTSEQMIERKKSVMDYLIKKNKPATICEIMDINNYTRTQIQNTMISLSNENKVVRNKKEKRVSYMIKKNRINALMMFYNVTTVRRWVW